MQKIQNKGRLNKSLKNDKGPKRSEHIKSTYTANKSIANI